MAGIFIVLCEKIFVNLFEDFNENVFRLDFVKSLLRAPLKIRFTKKISLEFFSILFDLNLELLHVLFLKLLDNLLLGSIYVCQGPPQSRIKSAETQSVHIKPA